MKAYLCFFLILNGLVTACKSSEVQPKNDQLANQKSGVGLYLITSAVDLATDRLALDRTPITIANEPLISYDQIESYTADTHTFQFKAPAANQLKELSSTIPLTGKPFALVIDDTIIYKGLFWNPISSFTSAYPFLTLDKASENKSIVVSLMLPAPGGTTLSDPRNDSRLLNRLKQDNKLK